MLKALLDDVLSDSFANNCGVECDVSRCQTHTVLSCCDYTAPVFHINNSDTKYEHWQLRRNAGAGAAGGTWSSVQKVAY